MNVAAIAIDIDGFIRLLIKQVNYNQPSVQSALAYTQLYI